MSPKTTVVSTRIKTETKKILEKAGLNISEATREHLEELAWKVQLGEEVQKVRELLQNVKPSKRGFAVRSVREDRESH